MTAPKPRPSRFARIADSHWSWLFLEVAGSALPPLLVLGLMLVALTGLPLLIVFRIRPTAIAVVVSAIMTCALVLLLLLVAFGSARSY
ncbi:hypothetical protein [Roseomonas sp. BN140053]|uniref:hypothetical protein n=1 Tax=Roseomonas sp. BN140053 TaxID=3391898 RepID=UPI0039EB8C90